MKTRALPLAAAVLVSALARSAAADEPPGKASDDTLAKPLEPPAGVGAEPAPPKPEEGPEVRVIGARADSLQRVPGSGTVIGSKTLERADPQDLAEILRRVPGVQARQEYGGGNRLDISIRGLDSGRSRRVLMLEDGIPLSLNPYAEPDMYFGPAVERYRAIEVVKGSGNILFGPQTLAGTVNFVTIAPPDHQTIMGDVEAGNFGYVRGLARYGDTIGDTRYVVQVLQRHGDGFRDQPFDSTDGLAKVIYPTGKDGELVLRLGFHRDENGSDDVGMTTQMWNDDPKRRTLAPHDHSILDRYDVALIHEQRFSSDTKLKTLVYAYETDRIWRRQDFVRAPVPGASYERIEGDPSVDGGAIYFANTNTVLDRQYTVVGLEPRAEHRMKTAGIGHTIDFGGRVEREQAHYSQRSGDYPDSFAGSDDFEERHTGTAFAAYLQDRMAMTDKLLVTPGIRWEHFEFRRTIQRENVGTAVQDVFQQGSQSVNGVVPGIGGIYGTKDANLFAGFHVGFAPPRITSAITAQGVPAEVHAENSLNYETGARVGPVRWLRLEATGFLSNFDNQVIASSQPGAGGETLLTDAGATNIIGLESGVLFSVDKAFGLGSTILEAGVRYNFQRATFRFGPNEGNILPYSPEHTVTANVDLEHPSGFGGQIAYAHVGPQFTDAQNTRRDDASGQLGPLDPWDIVDATVHYRHKPSGITLRLTGKNILDATYIIARRPNGIFPGPFRQFVFGVRWEWERAPRREGE